MRLRKPALREDSAMALKTTYLDDGHGVMYEASGTITGEQIIGAGMTVESPLRAARNIWYLLFDFDDVSGIEISTEDLRRLADIAIASSQRGSAGRVAGIYAKDNLPFALSRMWMVYVEQAGWETMVFRERSEAVGWIRERVRTKFGVTISLA
jgi:hypothetical protein